MNKNIATSDDLNTFLTYGIYQNYGGAPINAPTIAGGRPAMLVVFSRKDTTDTNGQLTQLYIDTNKINIHKLFIFSICHKSLLNIGFTQLS